MKQLWTEKYRPQTIDQMCAPVEARQFSDWLKGFSTKPGSLRGAMLSGPPGVGKTTSVYAAARSCGREVVELNASDHRSQKSLHDAISDVVNNRTIRSQDGVTVLNTVLLMDEVDGCDRGGATEIIELLKKTQIPIVCTCNDVRSPKLRSLLNHVQSFKFNRPRHDIVTKYILEILKKENCSVPQDVLNEMIQKEGNDIRSTLSNLQLWCLAQSRLSPAQMSSFANKSAKNVELSIFQAAEAFFRREKDGSQRSYEELQAIYYGADLVDLFVHENYVHWNPYNADWLDRVSEAATSISYADRLSKVMYFENNWSISPQYTFFSSINPSMKVRGHYVPFAPQDFMPIKFPQWLGNNSTTNKNRRLCQIVAREGGKSSCASSCQDLATDVIPLGYIPGLLSPMIDSQKEGIEPTCARLNYYNLNREDWDWFQDLTAFKKQRFKKNPEHSMVSSRIPTAVKSAFTREFNKKFKKDRFSYSKHAVSGSDGLNTEAPDVESSDIEEEKVDVPATASKKSVTKVAKQVGTKRPKPKKSN